MARLRFRTRLPAPDFRPGYQSRKLGAATTYILRALTSSIFGAGTF